MAVYAYYTEAQREKKERKKQRQKEECVDGRGSSQRSVRLYGCLYGTYLTTIHCTLYAPTNGKIV